MADITWTNYFTTDAGRTVLAWEEAQFARIGRNRRGQNALQIGHAPLRTLLFCGIAHQIVTETVGIRLAADDIRQLVLAKPQALPFADDSVDFIIWPHGPDDDQTTPQALSEITRVLAPNGVLVTTFFHQGGLWYLQRKSKLLSGILSRASDNYFPAGCTPKTASDVRRQLLGAGLSPEEGLFGVYHVNRDPVILSADMPPPPPEQNRGLTLPTLLDLAGDRWFPTGGNVVLLSARKKVQSMTLVGKAAFAEAGKALRHPAAVTARKESLYE